MGRPFTDCRALLLALAVLLSALSVSTTNTKRGTDSYISGGTSNTIPSDYTHIGAGPLGNVVLFGADGSAIAGGSNNTISAANAFIGVGTNNSALLDGV